MSLERTNVSSIDKYWTLAAEEPFYNSTCDHAFWSVPFSHDNLALVVYRRTAKNERYSQASYRCSRFFLEKISLSQENHWSYIVGKQWLQLTLFPPSIFSRAATSSKQYDPSGSETMCFLFPIHSATKKEYIKYRRRHVSINNEFSTLVLFKVETISSSPQVAWCEFI